MRLRGTFCIIFANFVEISHTVAEILYFCAFLRKRKTSPFQHLIRNNFLILRGTHTHLMALFPGLPRLAGTRKVKPICNLLKQETVSGSGISWAICKSAPCSRQTTTPAPYHCFLQAGCPSCHPTNSVKALKAISYLQVTE